MDDDQTGRSYILIALPQEVSESLVSERLARTVRPLRGSPFDPAVWIEGLQIASMMVTLAQTPQTIRWIAEALRNWRRSWGKGQSTPVSINTVKISIELTSSMTVAEIESVLSKLMSGTSDGTTTGRS